MASPKGKEVTLEDKVKALEEENKELWKRLEIVDASGARLWRLIDEQLSELSRIILSNITQMRAWNDDFQEHLKAHYLDKKERYASKRKTRY